MFFGKTNINNKQILLHHITFLYVMHPEFHDVECAQTKIIIKIIQFFFNCRKTFTIHLIILRHNVFAMLTVKIN